MRALPLRALSAGAALLLSAALLTAPPAAAEAAPAADGCDPIDPASCLLPFPSDWYTEPDPHTPTGLRIDMRTTLKDALGLPVSPDAWNRADGFSPGSELLARVPGVDLARTGAAPVTDIGASLKPDAPIVIVDTATGKRWPYWAELDANAPDDRKALIVRPAKNFLEGHHYAVALRNLRDASGNPIKPNAAFSRILGPALPSGDPLHQRQQAEKKVLADLAEHGVNRDGLYLAWDFTVASEQSLAGPMLHIRDDALRKLGDKSPSFLVTKVTNNVDDKIAREVKGVVWVPSYLDRYGGLPGSAFHYGKDGLPSQLPGNDQAAPFQCEIPKAALDEPAHPALYGHGLLGSEGEVDAGNVKAMAAEHDFVFCATKWIGMSDEDVPNVISALADLSRFRTVADRLQQGMLNFVFLGRAMTRGFATNKAFQDDSGKPLIAPGAPLSYDGNSQGGIMGGALTAVSPDLHRSVLGVPAMNYSTLLNRSADFPQYAKVLDLFYPDKLDQQIGLALIQMLWDRGEADGYAWHMTDHPYPGTPKHQVLMHVAFGDHQVATVAAEVEARTIGARIHAPTVRPGRSLDKVPYWNIPTFGSSTGGSAMVVWDSGSPAPPTTDTPPTAGRDPHSDPRSDAGAREQKAIFLTTGRTVDVCGGGPCVITP